MKRILLTLAALTTFSTAGHALPFTAGNLAVFQADSATANNTTGTIVEVNSSVAGPAIQTIPISAAGPNALRFSGSATSTGYLSHSDDRTLLTFTGHNSTTTSGNANTITARGVGALNQSGSFALPTTYTGTSGNQTRAATSLNNSTWFISDQGGAYTNGASSASPAANLRADKAFGGVVYTLQNSSTATTIVVSTISAASGGTITGLPGLTNSSTATDFYLVQSGVNGVTYDILYVLGNTSATAGSVAKYSLVGGSWAANGSYTSAFGGFGLAAAPTANGANLYLTTGTGATGANSVLKLFDAAGYNAAISINTPSNVTLFTAAAGTTLKGIDFVPLAAVPEASAIAFGGLACGVSGLAYSVRRRWTRRPSVD